MKHRKVAPLHALLYLPNVRQRRPRGETLTKCVILKTDNLGDVLLTLGAIGYVTNRLGEERCTVLCKSNTADLLRREFPKLNIFVVSTGKPVSEWYVWNTIRKIRQLKKTPLFQAGTDLLISLRHQRSMHLDMLTAAIPAARTVGSAAAPWSDFSLELVQSHFRYDVTAAPACEYESKEIASHAAVLSAAFGCAVQPGEILSRLHRGDRVVDPKKLLIAPFAGDRVREMNLGQLQQVLRMVAAEHDIKPVILCGAGDKDRAIDLAAKLSQGESFEVAWECTQTMEDMITAIASAGVVLTADSSPAHVACALDMPAVVLIGGGHPGWFGWRHSDKQVWLSNRVPCFGCGWICTQSEPFCLTQIPVQSIAREIVGRLSLLATLERKTEGAPKVQP